MSRFDRPSRVVTALVILLIAGSTWFVLALYSTVEMMGARDHPVVDFLAWTALGVAVLALVSLALDAFDMLVSRKGRRRGGPRPP